MSIRSATLLIFLFFSSYVSAQSSSWMWANTVTGTGGAYAGRAVTDPVGNIYFSGYFPTDTMIFGTDTLFHTNRYGSDIFIVKMDVLGNVLWTKNYPSGRSSSNDDFDHDVVCDLNGNVYVTAGLYLDSVSYGTTTLFNSDTSMYPAPDVIVLKFDASGNITWARKFGEEKHEEPQGIGVDANMNVYVTGDFGSDSIHFANDTLRARVLSLNDVQTFLLRYDSSGNEIWARQSVGDSTERAYNIALDTAGNIYLTGLFNSTTIQFGSLTASANNGFIDLFVVKYDSSGVAIWQAVSGGSNDDRAWDVAVDPSGNVIITGGFRSSSITFGSQTLTNNFGYYDTFVTRYDGLGNVIWARNDLNGNTNFGTSVCANSNGQIWITGRFSGPFLTFGTDSLLNSGSFGEVFIAKYDTQGNPLFATSLMGIGDDNGNQIVADVNGDVIITGYYWNDIVVGPYQLSHNGLGGHQLFIAKLGSMTTPASEQQPGNVYVYPNPATGNLSVRFPAGHSTTTNVHIVNTTGSMMSVSYQQMCDGSVSMDIAALAPGLYFLVIDNGIVATTCRFIKL